MGWYAIAAGTVVGLACAMMAGQAGVPKGAQGAKGPVVVELFTSEGCSSCPPADALLAKLDAEYRAAGKDVVFLAEHVDYWDDLGWKDPYASKEFSARQRAYSAGMKREEGGGVYTPQMVVDGRTALVGSDEAGARAAIERALGAARGVRPEATIGRRGKADAIRCEVKGAGVPKGASVLVALVENGLSTAVKRGENGGRTLKHERVVRSLTRADVKDGAYVAQVTPPQGVREQNAWVVVLVQDDTTRVIVGAAEMALVPPEKAPSGTK